MVQRSSIKRGEPAANPEREAKRKFREWSEDTAIRPLDEEVARQLEGCTDTPPRAVCRLLGAKYPSTYAEEVRVARLLHTPLPVAVWRQLLGFAAP